MQSPLVPPDERLPEHPIHSDVEVASSLAQTTRLLVGLMGSLRLPEGQKGAADVERIDAPYSLLVIWEEGLCLPG
jgi:hypothetical protein